MEMAMANGFGAVGFTELNEQEMMWVGGGGILDTVGSIASGAVGGAAGKWLGVKIGGAVGGPIGAVVGGIIGVAIYEGVTHSVK